MVFFNEIQKETHNKKLNELLSIIISWWFELIFKKNGKVKWGEKATGFENYILKKKHSSKNLHNFPIKTNI